MAKEGLEELRRRLDGIDDEIVRLLAERMSVSEKVGAVKAGEGREDPHEPAREAEVIRRLQGLAAGGLPDDFVDRVYREVFAESLRRQRPLRISYLGPAGTFSHEASLRHFGGAAVHSGEASIEACLEAVEGRRADCAIVPYENSTEGGVGETLDLLADTSLHACGEAQLRICQNLLGRPGQEVGGVTEVFSHPQSLAQCRRWLDANLPGRERTGCASNSAAAERAAKAGEGAAAVGPAGAAELYGLAVLAADIEDSPHNVTRFLVLGRDEVPPTGSDKTTMTVTVRHRPGALHAVLKLFADAGVNLSRLESRPIPGEELGRYRFFVDCEGHRDADPMPRLLDDLAGETASLKVIGSYPSTAVIG